MCKLHIIRYVLHALLYNHVLLSTDTAHFGHFFSVCLCLYYPHSSILSVSNPPLLSTQLFSLFVSFYLPLSLYLFLSSSLFFYPFFSLTIFLHLSHALFRSVSCALLFSLPHVYSLLFSIFCSLSLALTLFFV